MTSSSAAAPASHEELLFAVGKDRNRAAFVSLFEYYAPRIKSWLLRQGADDSAAEDITQAALVSVWEKAASFDPTRARASTWIYTIARNKRIDMMRREKFAVVDPQDPLIGNYSQGREENYVEPATNDKLQNAVAALPPEQAELLRMAFYEDKSHRKIADEKKLPLGTVKSRLRLAMDKLRQTMTQEAMP